MWKEELRYVFNFALIFNLFCRLTELTVIRNFGIPGESLRNVISARSFVGWYNGLPEDQGLVPDLSCEDVVVLGQGNVAIDVSRVLLKSVDVLKTSDITENALEILSKSRVKRVHLVGRRGPLQVAFTIKEFREMVKLPNATTLFRPEQLVGLESVIPSLKRQRVRLMQLIADTGRNNLTTVDCDKLFKVIFLRSPLEILGDSCVSGVKLSVNKLEGSDINSQHAVPTGEYESINCGMVLRSIGYRSRQVDESVPFDTKNCVALQQPGLYCAGWLANGPTGVILTTMAESFLVGEKVANDINEKIIDTSQSKPGSELILQSLHETGVQTTDFSDWEKIDTVEKERGSKVGKPREKVTSVQEMLDIVS
ncbi:NADPH:adrenodoxin oxidoreductase, mitochondrial isoform X2 [Nilaparvata lugens]|uniref:NADPH:adrenodoxin oxidoreductase, mitochondrial isoform X2 n=1 Tax=Nilaparvata lugens TaxID=108931 RepID=UPI00193D9D66|nr:NADPH:adrenodoxin oxidoreductase, mitochondrial isoform X2 [Nilaparvata lugens]